MPICGNALDMPESIVTNYQAKYLVMPISGKALDMPESVESQSMQTTMQISLNTHLWNVDKPWIDIPETGYA